MARTSLNAEVAALERKLSAALGMKVELSDEGQQGNVRISFADLDQLEWIARQLSSQRIRRKGVCPAAKGRRLAA